MDKLENQLPNSQQKSRLRVRCPHCYKLYSVSSDEVHEARPKFECTDCHGRFWIAYAESLEHASGVIGFPLEEKSSPNTQKNSEPATKPFACPKCGEAYAGGDRECTRCGVFFDKFSAGEVKRTEPSSSPELKDLWETALNEYDNFERHRQFLVYAQAEGNLEFALSKYDLILSSCPTDNVAMQARTEAKALLVARAEARMPIPGVATSYPATSKRVSELSGQRMPISSVFAHIPLRIPGVRFSTLIMFMCGVVIAMGLFVPGLRNLVGFGSSILFFILALRYYFRAI